MHCQDAEIKAKEQDESPMPVFMTVSTKFMKLSQPVRIINECQFFFNFISLKVTLLIYLFIFIFKLLEIVLAEGPPIRLSNAQEVVNNVISTQEAASLCNSLHKSSVANEGEVSLDLYKPGDKEPRYTIYVLDQLVVKEKKSYAAFIVPQGR